MPSSESESNVTVGCRALSLVDEVQGARVPLSVLYPSRAPETVQRFGPYSVAIATDAPVEGERLPLVVVSHGTGGSPWSYRGLAAHLARAGFAVALVEHPGNSRSDDHLAHTLANLENRPRHLRLALDRVLHDDHFGGKIAPEAVAAIGHSMGAYTVLALAGGHPTCSPNESPDGIAHAVPVVRDPRVRALVLLAPATGWYLNDGALAEVDLPILMFSGERDEHAPAIHGQIVERGVRDPKRLVHRVIPNANHFAFQSPFPPEMTRPEFPPSQDAPGFDRAAFQPVLYGEIEAFLRKALTDDAPPA